MDWRENTLKEVGHRIQVEGETKGRGYTATLNNKFQVLQELMEEEETIDSKWLKIKEAVTSTFEEVLGNKKLQHKEWISAATLHRIQERKRKKPGNRSRASCAPRSFHENTASLRDQ